MRVQFEILGEPQGKGRHRVQVIHGKVHTYTPDATANYENLVKVMYLRACGRVRLYGAIKAEITAIYSIPQSWSKKRKEEACKGDIAPMKKPDTDNIAKIILDSLNGVAYDDDKQVVELVVKKQYDIIPRVVVVLEGGNGQDD